MIVRMKGDVSGSRDGQDWPPRGSTVDLPDDEAIQLCRSGMAVPVAVDEDPPVERAVAVTTDVASAVVPQSSVRPGPRPVGRPPGVKSSSV